MLHDPAKDPDPAAWLALDEGERIAMVETDHRRARIRVPNLAAHGSFHAVVESQVAVGEDMPTRRTLRRLIRAGLTRHEAVRAIAGVRAAQIHQLIEGEAAGVDSNQWFRDQLKQRTGETWRAGG